MTREERELLEQCKIQLIHIHDVVGRKKFYTTKNMIKQIDKALTTPVVSKTFTEKQMDNAYDKGFTDGYEHARDGY